ncbi:MAG: hypothetical protein ACD_57C00048G0004 [uncultured bacterium]|nr:MAG: hypothetical protein ACD_57C00048G0004 [uncultured bacterium]
MPIHGLLDINLLPKDSFEGSNLGKTLKWLLIGGRTIVVLTEFGVILAFVSRFWYDKQLNDLNDQITQKQAVVRSFTEVENKMRDVLAREEIVGKFLKENLDTNGIIESLVTSSPVDVSFDQIGINKNGMQLSGQAKSESSFAGFLGNLSKNPRIKNINLGETKFSQKTGTIGFKISTNL